MFFDKNSEFALKYLTLTNGKIQSIRGTDQDDKIFVKCELNNFSNQQICGISINNETIDVSYDDVVTIGLSIFGHGGNDNITFISTGSAIFANVDIWPDQGSNQINLDFNWPKVSATVNLGSGENEIYSSPLGEALIVSGLENNLSNRYYVQNTSSSENFSIHHDSSARLLNVFHGEKQVCQLYESNQMASQNARDYDYLADLFEVYSPSSII
jgi:hypothetical protein